MALGIAFGYYILSPLSVNFLTGYRVSDNITNMIDVGSYISLVANLVLVCAIIFELPVAVHFLSKTGLLTASFMKRYRRHAIIVLAICAAIITPPDIMSMILVIIPLYLLYEMSIWIAKE
jgi:sec-independent protein translocase protein TatC